MSLHASGLNYFISEGNDHQQFSKKVNSYKKGDLSNLIDLQDQEIEIDNENKNNLDNPSFDIFCSANVNLIVSKRIENQSLNVDQIRYSYKLPLYIHFENYRL